MSAVRLEIQLNKLVNKLLNSRYYFISRLNINNGKYYNIHECVKLWNRIQTDLRNKHNIWHTDTNPISLLTIHLHQHTVHTDLIGAKNKNKQNSFSIRGGDARAETAEEIKKAVARFDRRRRAQWGEESMLPNFI